MKLGVFTVLFGDLPFEPMLEKVRSFGLEAIELGTGAYPGNAHCNLDRLLENPAEIERARKAVRDAGLTISAFCCAGNPLHPNRDIARAHHDVFRKTVKLAERMDVPVIDVLSGCPGDSETARYPNWAASAWPPDYPELLAWQWNEVAIPYWREAARLAGVHGKRKIAVEPHPGFIVYNPETALQLRAACGPAIGVNLDPSHLFWQGIDIPTAIRRLGQEGALFHVHAKDCALDRQNISFTGCLDAKPYTEMARRSWSFRTVGWGHGLDTWRAITSALRLAGYDYVLSIEHEDALASVEEGLRHAVAFLKQCLLSEPPAKPWWV